MCGIFGVFINKEVEIGKNRFLQLSKELSILSETRGKEASGFAFYNPSLNTIEVIKSRSTIKESLKNKELKQKFASFVFDNMDGTSSKNCFGLIGHTRLVTNGSQLEPGNNQPVVKNTIVGIHNGIIVNDVALWQEYPQLERKYEVDSEILFSLVSYFNHNSNNLAKSLQNTFQCVRGTVATAFLLTNKNKLVLATNNGSLYTLSDSKKYLVFASEQFILAELQKKNQLLEKGFIEQVPPDNCVVLDTNSFDLAKFGLNGEIPKLNYSDIQDVNFQITTNQIESKATNGNLEKIIIKSNSANSNLLEFNVEAINMLNRCTKCLLPETFPFISFNEKGVCNICNNYIRKIKPKGKEILLQDIQKYKSTNGSIDCIIPYSGGRDSSYSVHYIKKELGLNPITYTYDWGMVTDLARRNIARVCSKLGIENIIVSADIAKKRSNIQKNILAWLKKPELGMVPLFMAGDKQFHYYLAQVRKQNHIDLSFWGTNHLENTDFKLGFCGIDFDFDKERISSLNRINKIKLASFYLKNYLSNPSYINASIIDTLKSFVSRYLSEKKDYFFLYDYIKWDEKIMEQTLMDEYDWETAPDTKSTWRIGDGTSSFYNYIYYTVAGFSEYDTFRSNQIREGLITREEALELVNDENRPRFDSLVWYFNTIGLEFDSTIKRINSIPKLYNL